MVKLTKVRHDEGATNVVPLGVATRGSGSEVKHASPVLPTRIPFSTWWRALGVIAKNETIVSGQGALVPSNLPHGLDGTHRAALVQSLLMYGLIAADRWPTERLTRGFASDEAMKELLSELLWAEVPWALALSDTISQEELEAAFLEHGVDEAVLDRVMKFYVDARRELGMGISPLWRKSRGPKKGSVPRKPSPSSNPLAEVGAPSGSSQPAGSGRAPLAGRSPSGDSPKRRGPTGRPAGKRPDERRDRDAMADFDATLTAAHEIAQTAGRLAGEGAWTTQQAKTWAIIARRACDVIDELK